jgi:branched-chain amino acid transport system substrate-binding protein
MKKRFMLAGLIAVLLAISLVVVACGGDGETTTTAAPTTSTGPETTAAPTETTAAPTETTAGGGPATGDPVKVGLITSLTGPSASPGLSVKQGAELTVKYLNENGGLAGRPIELFIEDDASEVTGMVAGLTKLIEQTKVDYFVGPFIQYGHEAARDMCEQAKMVMVGTGPTTLEQQQSGKKYEWSIMMSSGPAVHADGYVELIKAHGYKNILAISDILSIHNETLDLLVKFGPDNGFTLTKMPDTFGFDQQDFQPLLNRIMEEYNNTKPDAVFIEVNPVAAPVLYKGLVALGVKTPIHGSPAAAHPAIFMMGPDAVEGFYVTDSGGIVNPAVLPDDWPVKQIQMDFVGRYVDAYGQGPDFFAACGSDYFTLLEAAVDAAGGVDDKEAVRSALLNLTDVPTLQGLQTFTPDETTEGVRGQMVEFQVKGGQFTFVRGLN